MKYLTIPPSPLLAEYVRFFWILECEPAPGEYYIHRSMADGCTELIFHYKGRFDEMLPDETIEHSFHSGFHGQSRQYRRFRIDRSFGIFGAYLFSYTLPELFGIPAVELSDEMPQLDAVLGPEGRMLEERMMAASTNGDRVRILSNFFMARIKKKTDLTGSLSIAVKKVIDQKGQIHIEDLAGQHCLSRRQFERKFKEASGFSPKLFARIARFQSIFPQLASADSYLTEVAYACGYYDQSHFIQDFREFSGFNPSEFLKKDSTETTNWTE